MKGKKALGALRVLVLWALSLMVFIPLAVIFVNAIKTQSEALAMRLTLPAVPQWGNYQEVARQTNIVGAFGNSLIISVSTVLLSVVGASMGTFVLARRRNRFTKAVYLYFLVGLVAPLNMVPAILVLQKLGLMNSHIGLILLYTALVMPFTVFLYYGFISTVPKELDEAATIDGASGPRLFASVVFPLLRPVTVTVMILNFMNAWNDFITPFYIINDSRKMPMTTMIYSVFGTFQRSWHLVSAMMVLIITPIIVFYLIGQKYIISGMVAGAVKG